MVVVPAGGSSGPGPGPGPGAGRWGTWEELLLGGAVERYGGNAWATVANELCARSPCFFSPEDCEAKFAEIKSRYCNAWYEELRKQRVAELKRQLEQSDNSISSLHSVIESLSNSKDGDGASDCPTNTAGTGSVSHSGNTAGTNLLSKELSRDRSSAGSVTEEASNCQKSQQVQHYDTDLIQTNNTSTEEPFLKAIEEKACANDSLFWGSRKQRGKRVGRILLKTDANSRNGEPTSTACLEREGSAEGCMNHMKNPIVVSSEMKKGLKAPSVESGAVKKGLKTSKSESGAMKKGLKTANEPALIKRGLTTPSVESVVAKKGLKTPDVESGVMKKGLETPNVESDGLKKVLKTPKAEPGVMKDGLKTSQVESGDSVMKELTNILNSICVQGDGLMLQRQVGVQRKRMRYKKMIRRHMDFDILRSKIRSGTISSTNELLRDLLLFVNNVIAFYPKATLEHKAAVELRDIAWKTVNESANLASRSREATVTASVTTVKKNAQAVQSGLHGPGDAKGSKVASREATASSRQGVGKDSRSDKPPAANLKTVQKSEPAKKRGVGRPPKSGSLKRSAPAQEDSPSRGRKRTRR